MDNANDWEGYRCEVCDFGFDELSWDNRHDAEDGITFVHEDCCDICNDPQESKKEAA